jgi:hypothetical protein
VVFLVSEVSGRAQINIGAVDAPGAFMNFMKNYGSISFSTASPSNFDFNGFPITTLAANVGGAISLPSGFAGNGVSWTLQWKGTGTIKFVLNTAVNVTAHQNCTVTGGSNSVITVTTQGNGGSVTFTFSNYSGPGASFYFPSGFANLSGMTDLALVRTSDLSAYNAGGIFTPEFISLLQDMNPKTIRPMGWVNTGSSNLTNQTQWRYRTNPNSLSWSASVWAPNAWAGTVSGTDTYTVGAAADTPGTWTSGEVIQCVVTNANTSTTPTLNCNSRGAKTIVNSQGLALSAGSIAAGSLATFVYDGFLDRVLYTSGGVTGSVPIEAQVALANAINANLWAVLPQWVDFGAEGTNVYVNNWAGYVRDNLASNLTFYPEYGNEIWNFVFPQTQWAYQRGLALGWPNANNEPFHGWYGLRVRQIMGNITSLWTANGRSSSTLKRVMGAYAIPSAISQANTYRLQGSDLVGATYPNYLSFVGGVDPGYNTAPNRPIDFCDTIAYAPYFQGANFPDLDTNYTAGMATALQTAATNFSNGGSGITTALAWLDNDIRAGTVSGVLGGQTLLAYSQAGGLYPLWETVAAGYDSGRSTPLTVEAYEGGLQCAPPSTSECTTLGLTAPPLGGGTATAAGASAQLGALLIAYKNSVPGAALVIDYMNQFNAQAHSKQPSWLTITGANQWSLLPGDIFSSPYQTYYGFKDYNNSKRRLLLKT